MNAEISQGASEGTEKQIDRRPGIDPVMYLKMLMVGFFEDLPSERAIASPFVHAAPKNERRKAFPRQRTRRQDLACRPPWTKANSVRRSGVAC
jgi:hypothetical protein